MELADKLLLLRKEKGWTQAVAAKKIAIQQSYLSKLENGHYVPSREVVEKLCTVYEVSEKELFIEPIKQTSNNKWFTIVGGVGLILMFSGLFSVFFSQTYYTYKTYPVEASNQSAVNLNYHFTDEYRGDKYIETFSGTKYEYALIAERDISRTENKILIVLGIVLFGLSCWHYIFVYQKKRQVVIDSQTNDSL